MKQLFFSLFFLLAVSMLWAQQHDRVIDIDGSAVRGKLNRFFNECVGAGRANEGLRADWQRQLRFAKEQLGFRYIRMHGLLHDDMGVYFEDREGNPIYNWQYIDELYDFLLSIQVRPFVELGFTPKALATGTQTIFWWKGNPTPPKDYDKWAGLIGALVKHWIDRYGEAEVRKWYFEVWNEPNLGYFWTGKQDGYFKLYDVTARAIKTACSACRVGGPATAEHAWVPELIAHCAAGNIPIDFISTHVYGIDKGGFDSGGILTYLSKKDSSIYGAVIGSRKEIAASALPNLQLHYTEWSASYAPTDPIHDSYHAAAYILEKLKRAGNAANSMSYWTFTDIFEENGPRPTAFYGGFGLINYQDIPKPTFFAYQFLNRLGDQELREKDSSSWLCKDEHGGIQALVWNYSNTHPDSIGDQAYFKTDLPAKPMGKITLKYNHIPAGKYKLTVYQVGYRVNDAYTAYIDLGSPAQLTRQQVEVLKHKGNGAPVLEKQVVVSEGKMFSQELEGRENDVFLVVLRPI